MEKNNNAVIVAVLIISIIGQAVSYIAIDQILERVLAPTQIQITVSGNETQNDAEISHEVGRIPAEEIEVVEVTAEEIETESGAILTAYPQGILSASSGVNYFGNQKETFYNLPMDGVVNIAKSRGIEGEYTIREDGCKMMGDYIIIAANQTVHPYGSLVETSLGTGIVLDTGGFATFNPTQVDIAVTW